MYRFVPNKLDRTHLDLSCKQHEQDFSLISISTLPHKIKTYKCANFLYSEIHTAFLLCQTIVYDTFHLL